MKEGAQSQLVCPWAILAEVRNWIIEIRGMCWYARSQLPIQTQKTTWAPTGPLSSIAKPSRVSGPSPHPHPWRERALLRRPRQQSLKLALAGPWRWSSSATEATKGPSWLGLFTSSADRLDAGGSLMNQTDGLSVPAVVGTDLVRHDSCPPGARPWAPKLALSGTVR